MEFNEYEYDEDKVTNKFPNDLFEGLLESAESLDFYGVDDNSFCVGVNGARMVLEAVMDPSDGYRSYFGCWRTTDVDKVFFSQPLARVKVVPTDARRGARDFSGWYLVDVDDGHQWLAVGTDYSDDYYPYFVFRYTPKSGDA